MEYNRPTPEQIAEVRNKFFMTRKSAAEMVNILPTTWQRYEYPLDDRLYLPIPQTTWELFLLKLHLKGYELPDFCAPVILDVLMQPLIQKKGRPKQPKAPKQEKQPKPKPPAQYTIETYSAAGETMYRHKIVDNDKAWIEPRGSQYTIIYKGKNEIDCGIYDTLDMAKKHLEKMIY